MSAKRVKLGWRRLDNSAKIFPISAGKKYSTVFRFSVLLKEIVNKADLEKAVNIVLEKYKTFKVRMVEGAFWYYFEENSKKIMIEEEKEYPCEYIDPKRNKGYLFKITYFKTKINIDIFHSLTDGNSGIIFFKEIIYTYLEIMHPEVLNENERKLRKIEMDLDFDTEDSYIQNYDKKIKSRIKSRQAYRLKGRKIGLNAKSVIHNIINLEELKSESKKNEITITGYLTAVLIYSIYKANYLKNISIKTAKNKKQNPIKICIPVNLKKYFNSKTLSNFFSYITLEADMNEIKEFKEIIEFVKKEFVEKLKEEEIIKTMSSNVKIGTNPILKIVPLTIKKILVRLSYIQIRKYTTITFSNIGRIGIIGKYQDYIEYFMMLIAPEPVEKIKCSSCSFGNNIVFTFTSILKDSSIEKFFYEFLKKQKINVRIESNGVLNDIS